MEYCVYIHTNDKQWLGALVAAYALKRYSAHDEQFRVEIIRREDFPFFQAREGQAYLRAGQRRIWLNNDLQSFTPLRFMPPELMGFTGRALVIDPDVFAVSDVWELLSRDMQGKAVLCRPRSKTKGAEGCLATSVMLLDCARLTHWQVEKQFGELFEFERDYKDWICLSHEEPDAIGEFEHEWNDFDRFNEQTKMVHNTKRKTQPWKTGLPVDFRPSERIRPFGPKGWWHLVRRRVFGEYALLGTYQPHPDIRQEQLFFGLLRECLIKGVITEGLVRAEMKNDHVRHDAFEVIDRTPSLQA